MKYFHRTSAHLSAAVARAAEFFGARLTSVEEAPRRRRFGGTLGQLSVSVQAEGGTTR